MKPQFSVMIPARLDSSRLPNKALADIGGKPMVIHTAQQAQKSLATQVVVATDHDDIEAACRQYGIECVRTGSHHQSGTTRLAEAAMWLDLPAEHIVVNVQGDEPMIPPELINRLAMTLVYCPTPMATAACPIQNWHEFTDPNVVKVVCNSIDNALYFSRSPIPCSREAALTHRHELPDSLPCLRHIGIYAYRADFLQQYNQLDESPLEHIERLEQLRVLWHGFDIAVEVLEHAPPVGVDTAEDLARVRAAFLTSPN